jgi:hypothetical protein
VKFSVLPAWIQCPECGYAMVSDASAHRASSSCHIYCGTPKCPKYLKRFEIAFQTIEGHPQYEPGSAS